MVFDKLRKLNLSFKINQNPNQIAKALFSTIKNNSYIRISAFIFILYISNLAFSVNKYLTIQYGYTLTIITISVLIIKYFKKNTSSKTILIIFYIQLTLIGIHAGIQYHNNKSLNSILYWIGERNISITQPGIATQTVMNELKLRPYGTFSHPNSLAGYISIISILIIYMTKDLKSRDTKKVLSIATIIISTGILIITNSQGSQLAFTMGLLAIKFTNVIFLISVSIIILAPAILLKTNSLSYDLTYRKNQINNFLEIIRSTNLLTGSGLNTSISIYPKFFSPNTQTLQPIHNIIYLFILETGLIVSIIALQKIKMIIAGTYKPIIVVILVTGSFDHYWLTLHQNIYIMILATILTYENKIT